MLVLSQTVSYGWALRSRLQEWLKKLTSFDLSGDAPARGNEIFPALRCKYVSFI